MAKVVINIEPIENSVGYNILVENDAATVSQVMVVISALTKHLVDNTSITLEDVLATIKTRCGQLKQKDCR